MSIIGRQRDNFVETKRARHAFRSMTLCKSEVSCGSVWRSYWPKPFPLHEAYVRPFLDSKIDGLMAGSLMDVWMDGWVDGSQNGWMDGWMAE